MVLIGSWMAASFDGALSVAKVMLAAESTNTVVFKSGGFEQPECELVLFTKLFLIKLLLTVLSAGSFRHFFHC